MGEMLESRLGVPGVSYIITGGVFVFAFMVLIGSQDKLIREEKAQEIRVSFAITEKLKKGCMSL